MSYTSICTWVNRYKKRHMENHVPPSVSIQFVYLIVNITPNLILYVRIYALVLK